LSIHYCAKSSELHSYLISKKPIYNENKKIIGIWAQGVNVSELFTHHAHFFSSFASLYVPRKTEQFVVELDNIYDDLNLPLRQSEVFFFLLRGKTSKEIAKILSLSPRTVESYLDEIKVTIHGVKG
jgi:ATP/maltotriose-dependent transcriptional regulator MalT